MKVVVVHRGARDSYQAALALSEAGQLERLVTDIYWREDSRLAACIGKAFGPRAAKILGAHRDSPLEASRVEAFQLSSLCSFALDKFPYSPFPLRARATRWTDHQLGRQAGEIARSRNAALLSYSYYGHSAFAAAGPQVPRILFQLHPHPATMREILQQELADHPDCAASLNQEWELALSDSDFDRMCAEARMADRWIAASSFTRDTLIENGAPPDRVHVATYGVNLQAFHPAGSSPHIDRPLRVLFVGTVNQRKGIKYLLQAIRSLGTRRIQLVVRGRAVDDLNLVRSLVPDADIRLSVSRDELVAAYQNSDLFVFPSVGEGFGHVLIESLASGLPVLSTTHTAAPDLVTEGVDGFVIEPRRTDLIADRLEWALSHRRQLASMRHEARRKAEEFTWPRFRSRIREIVASTVSERAPEETLQHV